MRKPHHLLQRTLMLALAAALLAACAGAGRTPVPIGELVLLRLIAFNDLHGNLESTGLTLPWPDPAQPGKAIRLAAGGATHLSGTVQALRAGARHSLVISSGDAIGATPLISALYLHESTVDVMNRMGVDLAIPGNHEFDAGKDELLRVLGGGCRPNKPDALTQSCPLGESGDSRHPGARFPHFVANVVMSDGKTLFPPSVVKTVEGVRVGFIGAVTRVTPSIVVPSGVAGLTFTDEADAINAEAARLQAQGIQALVAVVHEGGDTGTPGLPLEWNDAACPSPRGAIFDIAKRLSPDIDVIFSAHTHQGYRCVLDGRPIMQATSLGRGVSVADLVIDPRSGDVDRARTTHRNLPVFNERSDASLRAAITADEPEPFASTLRAAQPDAAVAERVAAYAQFAAPRAARPVGLIGGAFERVAKSDASAGRLVADAQWNATRGPAMGGAQFALMNPGGVRTDLRCARNAAPPCAVTFGEVFTMQPFGNSLVVMTLTGAQLRQMLEDQQRPGRQAPVLLIPSSSLTYRWVAKADHGQRVQDLRLAGAPIDPAAEVRFTVNSFLADGGDGFVMLREGRQRMGGELDIDALIAHLKSSPSPDPVPRITWVD
jgi:5'-nucleotidase